MDIRRSGERHSEPAHRLEHEIIVFMQQISSERSIESKAQGLCRRKCQLVAQFCEDDEAVEVVIAVFPPPADTKVEVDFGARRFLMIVMAAFYTKSPGY